MAPLVRRKLTYLLPVSGVAFSLPVSVWLLSLFTILTLAGWLIGREWKRIRLSPVERMTLISFLSIYCVYLLWMLNTSDLDSGLTELRLKLPLLIFPLVFAFSDKPDLSETRTVLTVFICGLIISSAYGLLKSGSDVFSGHSDPRSLSPFISHIRMALMVVFGIFTSGWLTKRTNSYYPARIFFIISTFWLLIYLFILLSLTGIFIFIIVLFISALSISIRSGRKPVRILLPHLVLIVCGIGVLFVLNEVKSFYHKGGAYPEPAEIRTANGNRYYHDAGKRDLENGNRVWIYMCEPELKKEWNRISRLNYDSSDRAGQPVKFTLVRYITSAGLRKDSAGVAHLKQSDVLNIENGMTNCLFSKWSPWKKKVYETIWQIDYYRNGGNPSRHSLTQRLEFLTTGWHIFQAHPLLGNGTGDIPSTYSEQYEKENSKLEPAYRLLCHNQFLSFLVAFGLIGTVIICTGIFFPYFNSHAWRNYLCSIFLLIVVLSMIGEDTLETHTGVTFFVYFYSFFLFTRTTDERSTVKSEIKNGSENGSEQLPV